jgi:viroplasmin and RNaseH domain-containing protein
MMARAFKVPVPKSYNNVTEAKLVQKGNNVWVQLPANMVTDRRMSNKSVYMDDFNSRPFHCHRYRNVKPKVVTRRSSYPQISSQLTEVMNELGVKYHLIIFCLIFAISCCY